MKNIYFTWQRNHSYPICDQDGIVSHECVSSLLKIQKIHHFSEKYISIHLIWSLVCQILHLFVPSFCQTNPEDLGFCILFFRNGFHVLENRDLLKEGLGVLVGRIKSTETTQFSFLDSLKSVLSFFLVNRKLVVRDQTSSSARKTLGITTVFVP